MNFEKLEAFLKNMKDDYGVPSCECRIIRKGETVFDCKAGDYDEKRNVYFIYSMTKMVTAVTAMRLIEQGKLSLSDKVEKYLPEFAELTVKDGENVRKAKNKITVEHLLSMQGGFNYDLDTVHIKEAIKNNPNVSTEEMVIAIGKSPIMFEPGEGFAYSLCYDVLGAVIEKAAGVRFGEYMKKEVLEPLGMNETSFNINEPFVKRLAPHYKFNSETDKAEEIPGVNRFVFSSEYESGGAGLISTFDDYCKFVTAISRGGTAENGYVLLKKESIDEICKMRMTDKMLKAYHRYAMWGCHYGFSVRVLFDKEICETFAPLGCFELTGAAGSYAVFDLENDISIVYFQHITDVEAVPEYIHHKIRDLAYEELLK